MKIRTPTNECHVCDDLGVTIIYAFDERGTYFAIKKLRQFFDALIEEKEQHAPPP